MAVSATDLVFPKGNEEHLVAMAMRLGVKHLILCYSLKDPLLKERGKEVAMLARPEKRFTTEFAILVQNQQEIARAKSITRSLVGIARPELFEDKRVAYIIDLESGRRDDFIHHRNSGLNQVFIADAKRTDKTLLINAHNLLFGAHPPAVILGRIKQNAAMLKKYAPRSIVVSGAREPLEMRPPRDLSALLRA